LKDGVELTASDRVKFMTPDSRTFILLVSRVEESDLGVYECRATNKVSSQSSKAKLIITGRPLSRVSVCLSVCRKSEFFSLGKPCGRVRPWRLRMSCKQQGLLAVIQGQTHHHRSTVVPCLCPSVRLSQVGVVYFAR